MKRLEKLKIQEREVEPGDNILRCWSLFFSNCLGSTSLGHRQLWHAWPQLWNEASSKPGPGPETIAGPPKPQEWFVQWNNTPLWPQLNKNMKGKNTSLQTSFFPKSLLIHSLQVDLTPPIHVPGSPQRSPNQDHHLFLKKNLLIYFFHEQ